MTITLFQAANAHHRPNFRPEVIQKFTNTKCGCINTSSSGFSMFDPKNTCSESHWCFVSCSSDCYDVKPTDGGRRCFSVQACEVSNLLINSAQSSPPSPPRSKPPTSPKVECKCINPLSGDTAVMGDPDNTCVALDYCFVDEHADCPDVKPAPGEGRWWSHEACDLNPIPKPGNIPIFLDISGRTPPSLPTAPTKASIDVVGSRVVDVVDHRDSKV